jgi:hypothetical protein
MRSVVKTVTGVTMENVVKAKAGDCWQPKRKIAWFQGGLDRIEAAYEALRHAGYHVDEFQRHPHGWDKVPKPCGTAEERTMKTLLRDLEESRARPSGLPVVGAEPIVSRLAEVQQAMVKVLDDANAEMEKLWAESTKLQDGLKLQLDVRTLSGATLAPLFAKYKIDAGDGLGSRLVDQIEKTGGKVYPEPYPVQRSRWALVER